MNIRMKTENQKELDVAKDYYLTVLIGKHAYCPIRHVNNGHGAKVGAYCVFGNGACANMC